MKKLLLIFVILSLIVCIVGCKTTKQNEETNISFMKDVKISIVTDEMND